MDRFWSFLGGVLCVVFAVAQATILLPLQVTTLWSIATLVSLVLGTVIFGVGGVLLIINAFSD